MQVCALHSPPVRWYGGTSLVCRRWHEYSNKKNLFLHHILQEYAIQEKNKAVSINLHLTHPRLPGYMLRQFLPSVRASVLIHEPSRAVLARGTFESIVVTNKCTNTLYYRTAVEFLPDGNIECPSRIDECARVHSPDGLLPCYSLSSRSNSM